MKNSSSSASIAHYGKDYHKHTCPKCRSSNLATGAGKRPGQMSLRCSECKAFIGYKNLQKLKKLKRQKRLTPCLELLEKQGLSGDVAIFVLSAVGVSHELLS
jgi:transposase-like protein